MCSPECLLPGLIQRMARGSLSATAAARRVGFGRRGSRTPTIGGRLRHPRRWLRTQRTAAARPCPFACRPSCVISRLCTCCRWVMSSATHVSPVSGVPARLADQGIGAMTCRARPGPSPPSRSVSLANPLADTRSCLHNPSPWTTFLVCRVHRIRNWVTTARALSHDCPARGANEKVRFGGCLSTSVAPTSSVISADILPRSRRQDERTSVPCHRRLWELHGVRSTTAWKRASTSRCSS